jgi:hypothetical protein
MERKKIHMDIGIGNSERLLKLAKGDQETHFIGVDVDKDHIEDMERKTREMGLKNVEFLYRDVNSPDLVDTLPKASKIELNFLLSSNTLGDTPTSKYPQLSEERKDLLDRCLGILEDDGTLDIVDSLQFYDPVLNHFLPKGIMPLDDNSDFQDKDRSKYVSIHRGEGPTPREKQMWIARVFRLVFKK